ncbi:hypothetical protein GBA52_012433 [Prunus armeniaca]|nr:hypothetical protein GBA52_012433 [Prunus armeniaca]
MLPEEFRRKEGEPEKDNACADHTTTGIAKPTFLKAQVLVVIFTLIFQLLHSTLECMKSVKQRKQLTNMLTGREQEGKAARENTKSRHTKQGHYKQVDSHTKLRGVCFRFFQMH